jgi:hypothetical protein
VIAMAAEVDLCGTRPVGAAPKAAPEIDGVVHIVHRGGSGVLVEVGDGREALAAPADGVDREGAGEDALGAGHVAVEIARERVGASGTALVDEDDVAADAELAVLDEWADQVGSGLSGSAGENDERGGCTRRGEGREDDDVEGNPAPGLRFAIFPGGVGGAAGFVGDAVERTGMGFGFNSGGVGSVTGEAKGK